MPAKDPEWREAFAMVGELVLLASALDHQLNHVTIAVLHLEKSPMLEPVVATLDPSRKVEILKARSKHIAQKDWKKSIERYLDKVERVLKARNIACHSPLIKNDRGFEFAPPAASKLLKSLDLAKPSLYRRSGLKDAEEAISVAEGALRDGESILHNFTRVSAELKKRGARDQ
jgi:hypothetical protein